MSVWFQMTNFDSAGQGYERIHQHRLLDPATMGQLGLNCRLYLSLSSISVYHVESIRVTNLIAGLGCFELEQVCIGQPSHQSSMMGFQRCSVCTAQALKRYQVDALTFMFH